MSSKDPFAKYGGNEDVEDPFAKYGGSAITPTPTPSGHAGFATSPEISQPQFARPTRVAPIQAQLELQHAGPYEKPKKVDAYNAVNDILAASIAPVRTGAALTTGIAAGMASGSPTVGNIAMSAMDTILRNFTGEEKTTANIMRDYIGADIEKGTPIDQAVGAAENAVINEIGGRAMDVALRATKGVVSELMQPGSVVDPYLAQLKATYSQYRGGQTSFMDLVEDVFARKSKIRALEGSANIALSEAEKRASTIAGAPITAETYAEDIPKLIEERYSKNLSQSYAASGAKAEASKMIANQNVLQFPNPIVTGFGPNGKPIIGGFYNEAIAGPVPLNDTLKEVIAFKNDIAKSAIKPDPDSPVLKAVDDILNSVKTIDPNTGGNIYTKPLSFEAAWKTKQVADGLGYGEALLNRDAVDIRFQKIATALNKDIEASMNTAWTTNGQDAANLFREAKQIVQTRHEIWNPVGEQGVKAANILYKDDLGFVNFPNPVIDGVISNPRKLERMMLSGELKVGNTTYTSNNIRDAVKSYKFMQMMTDSQIQNWADPTQKVFSGNALMGYWTDANNQQTIRQIYNSRERADLTNFFRAITNTSQKLEVGGSRYLKLKIGSGIVTLGSNLVGTAVLGTSFGMGGIVGGGLIGGSIGLNFLGKLATNPTTARLMAAAVKGGPLNMSNQMASRLVMNVLRGSPMTLEMADGNNIEGKVNAKGEFEPDDTLENYTKRTIAGLEK